MVFLFTVRDAAVVRDRGIAIQLEGVVEIRFTFLVVLGEVVEGGFPTVVFVEYCSLRVRIVDLILWNSLNRSAARLTDLTLNRCAVQADGNRIGRGSRVTVVPFFSPL